MPASYAPPFTITPAILSLVAEIAGEVGRLGALAGQGNVPKLRRENRIKSIHASLAIENSTLTTFQLHRLHRIPAQGHEKSPLSAIDCMARFKLSHRPTFRTNYLHPALEQALIERTIPGKPNSRLQKYRLTAKGRSIGTSNP